MKKTALILALIMIVCYAGAVSADDSMQRILLSVKDRVDIPERCTEFSSDVYTYDGETTYDFSWNYSDGNEYEHLGVDADADGVITSVYHYNSSDYDNYDGGKIIPKISKEQAVSLANAAMAKLNPDIAGEYVVADSSYAGNEYYVSYDRYVNGIPTPDYASFWIYGNSGRLDSFNLSYQKNISFAPLDGVLSEEEAKGAFKKGALRKEYQTFGDDKTARIVYYIGDFYMINAFTGEKYVYFTDDDESYGRDYNMPDAEDSASMKSLTPQEISVLDEIDGLLGQKELEEKLFAIKELGLKGATVYSTSLVKDTDGYYMNISLEKDNESFFARMNAQSGQLVQFYGYGYSDKTEDADDFIEKYYPEYIDRTQQSERGYRVRVENGLEYPQNYISAKKDSENGRIVYFSMNFDEDITFISPENILSEDKAYDIMYSAVSPELSYEYNGKKAVPVYTLYSSYFSYIDAMTGEFLDYLGQPAVKYEKSSYEYDDISGHFAQDAIKALGDIGVGFDGGAFMPDEIITQEDFAALVSQCIYDYVIYKGNSVDTGKTADYCIQRGIIKQEEYYPDEPLTRERAVEILLRSMNYEKFASIRGIFKVDFLDAPDIDDDVLGYVAIASGLKLVQGTGGYFYPKENITRGQAAVIIYNYLSK